MSLRNNKGKHKHNDQITITLRQLTIAISNNSFYFEFSTRQKIDSTTVKCLHVYKLSSCIKGNSYLKNVISEVFKQEENNSQTSTSTSTNNVLVLPLLLMMVVVMVEVLLLLLLVTLAKNLTTAFSSHQTTDSLLNRK